ncbi:MAG TPA: type II toxin-antitoxin system Phd/YefM family antitoxin [Trebonia sp.]|nr:type II toxin-antitoxin system Phd/YefM family antitoxin [Trebonia sp.]
MAEPIPPHWQLQEAKQRFSEVIRAVEREGPQIITRHGEDVAVIITMTDWHKLTTPTADLKELLLTSPPFDDDSIAILDEVEAERKQDYGHSIDLME